MNRGPAAALLPLRGRLVPGGEGRLARLRLAWSVGAHACFESCVS